MQFSLVLLVGKRNDRFDYFFVIKKQLWKQWKSQPTYDFKIAYFMKRGLMWICLCHPSSNIVILWCGWDGKYQNNYIFWLKNEWSWLCENFMFKGPRIKKLKTQTPTRALFFFEHVIIPQRYSLLWSFIEVYLWFRTAQMIRFLYNFNWCVCKLKDKQGALTTSNKLPVPF